MFYVAVTQGPRQAVPEPSADAGVPGQGMTFLSKSRFLGEVPGGMVEGVKITSPRRRAGAVGEGPGRVVDGRCGGWGSDEGGDAPF